MFATKTLLALCACAMLIAPGVGMAQTIEATPIPMPTKPDFSSLQFLVGTWSCSTQSARRPAPYISTSTYTLSPDGWWIEETTVQNPVPWFPQKVALYDKITYDPTTKRWIDVSYGDGGAYGLTTSSGWTGNTVVWHDPTFAPNSDVTGISDTTFTKSSDTKVMATSSFTEANGRNVSVVSTCTKNS